MLSLTSFQSGCAGTQLNSPTCRASVSSRSRVVAGGVTSWFADDGILDQLGADALGDGEVRRPGLVGAVEAQVSGAGRALDPDRVDRQPALAVDVEAQEALPVLDPLAGEELVGVPVEALSRSGASP